MHGVLPHCVETLSGLQLEHPEAMARCLQESLPCIDEILRLKTCWNATVPISRLPPELLSMIFMAYAMSTREDYTHLWKDTAPYSWLRVAHVCRHWRNVSLSYSALWSWIVPASTACHQVLLERAREAPLTIDARTQLALRTHFVSDPSAIGALYGLWGRIGHAIVEAPHSGLTTVHAPLLHTLEVYSSDCSDLALDDEAMFSAFDAPCLKRLYWTGDLQWEVLAPLLGPKIEVLELTPASSILPIETWLTVLQDLPCLRVLSLDGAVQTESARTLGSELPTQLPVCLSHLQKLNLSSRASILGEVSLLSHLAVPSTANISFSAHFISLLSDDDARALSSAVAAATSNRHVGELSLWRKDMSFFCPRTTLRWTLRSSASADGSPASSGTVSIELRVDLANAEHTAVSVTSGLPLANTSTLRLTLADAETQALSATVLVAALARGRKSHLRTLVVEGQATKSVSSVSLDTLSCCNRFITASHGVCSPGDLDVEL